MSQRIPPSARPPPSRRGYRPAAVVVTGLPFPLSSDSVGSVCKRNKNPSAIEEVLRAIKAVRPDLRLHAFGTKLTALGNAYIRDNLESSDSMAWSFGAWKEGRNPNDWREAASYCDRVQQRLAA